MLVGVQTIQRGPEACEGNANRFLKRFLETAAQIQSETRFVVFTHAYNHQYFREWDRVQLEAPGAMDRWRGRYTSLEAAAKKSLVDVLFSPLNDLTAVTSLPQVCYALDVADWEQQGDADQGGRRAAQLRAMKKHCAQARAIVVTSDHLKRRCLELFEAPLDKTIVAKPGVSKAFYSVQESVVERPYILIAFDQYTAARLPRVCEIFRKRRDEFPHTLVLIGAAGPEAAEHWDDRVVRIEECPDTLLSGLYQNSDLFLYPALHDGNALRPLEGMASRAPLVIANTGAIAELAGSAPFYFNGASAASLLQAVRRALSQEEEARAERLELGRRTAMAYTWEKTAWKVLSAFKRV